MAVENYMKVSYQLHVPAHISAGTDTPTPFNTFLLNKTDRCTALTGLGTTDRPALSLVAIPTTLYFIQADVG